MINNIAPGGSCQQLSISTTSTQSAAINARVVHVTPTADCFMRGGTNPTALSNGTDHFLVANATQEFRVDQGGKLAFITASGTGAVYIAVVA
jgi:hypothetical protein